MRKDVRAFLGLNILGKLPYKLKRFEKEPVKQKLYEKFKIYWATERYDCEVLKS